MPGELSGEPVRDGFRKMGEEGLSIEGGGCVLFFLRRFRLLTLFEEGFLAFCEQVFLGDDAEIKVGVVARSIALEGGDLLEAAPDRGEVSVVERGGEDPVQVGAGMGDEVRGEREWRIISAAGERGHAGGEHFFRVLDGSGEVEGIAGTGHGDVEEACFFGTAFTLGGGADGVPVEGGPAQASFDVEVLDTEAEPFVAEGDAGHVRGIEVFREVGEKDDGKFQSFAAVDGHDTDGIGRDGVGLCLETAIALEQARQLCEEGVETVVRACVARAGELIEGKQVGAAGMSAGKAGDVGEVVGVLPNLLKEWCDAALHGMLAPCAKVGEEGGQGVGLFSGEQGRGFFEEREEMVCLVFFHEETETGEVCLREPYEEGAEHGGERQVLQRVIQDLKESDECLYFQILHIVIVSRGDGRDVMLLQDLEQGGAFRCDGAEEDHDVSISDGTEGAVLIHHLPSFLDEAFDMAGDEAAFGVDRRDLLELGPVRLGEFAAIDEFDRDAAADVVFRARFFVASRVEGFGVAVGELQIFLCHELPKKIVDGGEDGGIASEVAVQVDALAALAFLMEAVVLG